MESVVFERYGPPADVLELRELEQPTPNDDEVLVRVRASSVNPAEWYAVTGPLIVRGTNGLRGPKEPRVGIDYAGVVEAVGKDVTEFEPGDEVFGGRTGAYGEYVCARAAGGIARKPKNVSFEEAGVVGIAGVTALQGLRDKGRVKAGDKVLITGASGGVGTFAVQIAKALGAEVTAVCRTQNVDLVRSLGADRVIDYTREDFTRMDDRYDVLLDIASTRSWADSRRVLKASGTLVLVGAPAHGRALGPLGRIVRMFVAGKLRGSPKVVFFVARITKDDMDVLRELIDSGKVKPVVEHRFPLERVAEALERIGTGHTRGKIAITM